MNTIKDLYTSFTAELEVMSPIFIGSGDELNKTRYFWKQAENIVYIVDDKKFQKVLAKNNLFESFQKHLLENGDKGNLIRWAKENNINISNLDIWKYSLKTKNLRAKDNKRDSFIQLHNIKTFIKGANAKPYIPGSSIKGAIRTALLYLELVENKEKYAHHWTKVAHLTDGRELKKALGSVADELEKEIFGTISESIFRAISVADSKELDYNALFVGQRNDFAKHKKSPSVMPIEYEFLNIGTRLKFDVVIDENLNKNGFFTQSRIEKALNEFAKFQNVLYKAFANKSDTLFLPNEINETVEPNMCLGGSSGFWSKTIVYAIAPNYNSAVNVLRLFFSSQFDRGNKSHKHMELDKEVSPHAMKVYSDSGDYIPIGWCKFKLVEKK